MSDQAQPAEVLRPLRRVRQVREFTPEPPSDAALDALADVGRWTGSSRNDPAVAVPDHPRRRPSSDRIWKIGVPQTRALARRRPRSSIVLARARG